MNQWEFIERSDRLVPLELDQVTQGERVSSRDRLFQERIADGLPVFQARMLDHGAARVDATRATTDDADAVIHSLAM